MSISDDSTGEQWPAVDAAFAFVIPSYQLLVSRFEAADTRLTSLLTVILGLTGAVPAFAKILEPGVSFTNAWFWGVVIFAASGVVIGVIGRIVGRLVLPDPMVMHQKSLGRSPQSFKMAQLYFAGENFDKNAKAIEAKGAAATLMTMAFCLEVTCLVAWLAR